MGAIAQRVAEYWANDEERMVISILKGILASDIAGSDVLYSATGFGTAVLNTDMLIDAAGSAVARCIDRHHEVLFFHTLAPEEEEFPFRRPARFRDLERPGRDLRVDPATLRAAYLERFEAFRSALKERVRSGLTGKIHLSADRNCRPERAPCRCAVNRSMPARIR